jgi:hypothetical protein
MRSSFSAKDHWRFYSRQNQGLERVTPHLASWQVEGDPISDDYTREDIDAEDLFNLWAKQVGRKHRDGIVPIYWSVLGEGGFGSEAMPFQLDAVRGTSEDFLTFYTWPVHDVTNELLNWLGLPVINKLWNWKQTDKGGFIQEHTGWKPSILQPYLYLPAILSVDRPLATDPMSPFYRE